MGGQVMLWTVLLIVNLIGAWQAGKGVGTVVATGDLTGRIDRRDLCIGIALALAASGMAAFCAVQLAGAS